MARLEKLRTDLALRHARVRTLLGQAEEARTALDRIEGELAIAERDLAVSANIQPARYVGPGDGRDEPGYRSAEDWRELRETLPDTIKKLQEDRAKVAARLAAMQAEVAAVTASWDTLARLVARCEEFAQVTPHAYAKSS